MYNIGLLEAKDLIQHFSYNRKFLKCIKSNYLDTHKFPF